MTEDEAYERGIERLAVLVKRVHEGDKTSNPTPERKALEAIAEQLDETADLLNSCEALSVERVHEERATPELEIGLDGWPIEEEDSDWPSMEAIKWDMRTLADSAREAVKRLPKPRQKMALPFAALGLLHLRYWRGIYPTFSNNSEDVAELDRVCKQAGISRYSPERLRGALREAFDKFDKHYLPPGYESLSGLG